MNDILLQQLDGKIKIEHYLKGKWLNVSLIIDRLQFIDFKLKNSTYVINTLFISKELVFIVLLSFNKTLFSRLVGINKRLTKEKYEINHNGVHIDIYKDKLLLRSELKLDAEQIFSKDNMCFIPGFINSEDMELSIAAYFNVDKSNKLFPGSTIQKIDEKSIQKADKKSEQHSQLQDLSRFKKVYKMHHKPKKRKINDYHLLKHGIYGANVYSKKCCKNCQFVNAKYYCSVHKVYVYEDTVCKRFNGYKIYMGGLPQ